MARKKSYGLLVGWVNHINDHHCSNGILALRFLNRCIKRGIVEDRAIWDAASKSIKAGLYSQLLWRHSNRLRADKRLIPGARVVVEDSSYGVLIVTQFYVQRR